MAFFNTFKSGDVVPTSGSYTALHSTPHKLLERAVHVEGERFEQCKLCPLAFYTDWSSRECRLLCLPTSVMKPWRPARSRPTKTVTGLATSLSRSSLTAHCRKLADNKRPASY
jgi:hypothetical protein